VKKLTVRDLKTRKYILQTDTKHARVRRVVGFVFLSKAHRVALFLVYSLEACYGDVWSCLDL